MCRAGMSRELPKAQRLATVQRRANTRESCASLSPYRRPSSLLPFVAVLSRICVSEPYIHTPRDRDCNQPNYRYSSAYIIFYRLYRHPVLSSTLPSFVFSTLFYHVLAYFRLRWSLLVSKSQNTIGHRKSETYAAIYLSKW